ncbi:hypothetical protein [Agromyces larvae]|uniref:Head-to-tail stopper n=1 Tax=Agromyces larvae TaxID=2929802 RepID=A0ABY4C9W4_9MICO|nr:hypothetical protein [Agromyces larvae]UOE45475.1 hypothetical protein MTO99_06880 [Agromyces larvae]
MEFPFGEPVVRERRTPVTNPYDPGATVPGPWDGPLDELPIDGAFIGSSTSTAPSDATRQQVLTSKSLFCVDPAVDVQVGDRIRRGSEVYYVNARPEADTNPFTGWQPVVEIPLDMTEG